MIINLGDKVRTPRFCTIRIAAMFENQRLAEQCGFSEPTHFDDQDFEIKGKSIGINRMLFAAVKRNEEEY